MSRTSPIPAAGRPAHWLQVLLFSVVVTALSVAGLAGVTNADRPALRPAKRPPDLPVVGSFEKLRKLIGQPAPGRGFSTQGFGATFGGRRSFTPLLSSRVKFAAAPEGAGAAVGAGKLLFDDFSTTNIQVRGVDEADIVKTDGAYIYQVNGRRIVISRVRPADKMRVVSRLRYPASGFVPIDLYTDDRHLVVAGHGSRPAAPPQGYAPNAEYREGTARMIVYDIKDRSKPVKIREVELDGEYLSSRKIGSAIYLVANKYVDVYRIMNETTDSASLTPQYRDSAARRRFTPVGYSSIKYFPGALEPNYLLVTGFSLDRPDEPAAVSTYLGAGQNIYASTENLYVAATTYRADAGGSGRPDEAPVAPATNTDIYAFALDDGRTSYRAKGQVPGQLLNQFSMDEHNGHLRVATTKGEVWETGDNRATNNVYVLDAGLRVTGRLENLAPGERIYSVRFMGDRGYVVTFKKVDPLFVIGLADPAAPSVLGELKIPGYSDYLHPYDENHIIGFGKDAVDSGQGDFAWYQGMKIAMFDVSDVAHPVEKFKTAIGDRGTESELLHNHKALLFDRARNLMAFPVTVMEVRDKRPAPGEPGMPEYGDFAFQGAYVYNVSLNKGLELKGRITHLTDGRDAEPWVDTKHIQRILYIGDTLYTVSNGMIKANDLADLKEKGSLALG